MKKIYLLAFAVCAFAFNADAQIIEDSFEFYVLGDMGTQAGSGRISCREHHRF